MSLQLMFHSIRRILQYCDSKFIPCYEKFIPLTACSWLLVGWLTVYCQYPEFYCSLLRCCWKPSGGEGGAGLRTHAP